MPMTLTLHEVGLRDGLQMEHLVVPTMQKLAWIRDLLTAGIRLVQVGSFVHPEKVPQMADTDRLFAALREQGLGGTGTVFSALVLNEKGLERGLAAGADMLCMGVSASETHSRKNTGMPIDEATNRIIAMAHAARKAGKTVQVSVQSAFGCGYEGPVPPDRVLGIARRFLDEGLTTISLADTAGHGVPDAVERMFAALRAMNSQAEFACHFHNTYGLALANCCAALRAGVTSIETSLAGLGGCPFTRIAGGNACTEDTVHMLQHMGHCREIHLERLIALAGGFAEFFGRELPGTIYKVGTIPGAAA